MAEVLDSLHWMVWQDDEKAWILLPANEQPNGIVVRGVVYTAITGTHVTLCEAGPEATVMFGHEPPTTEYLDVSPNCDVDGLSTPPTPPPTIC